MKQPKSNRIAIAILAIGLILASGTPILSRFMEVPDMVKGFIIGAGMLLEFYGIIRLARISGKQSECIFKRY